MIDDDAPYLIWSGEHEAWWGPMHCGYVNDVSAAGRYTLAEAGQIVVPHIPPGSNIAVDEVYAARWREQQARGEEPR